MLSLKDELYTVSELMRKLIVERYDVKEIPTDNYGWENHRYSSSAFRQAHVERFFQDGMLVLHVTVIPNIVIPAPIYGFDVVANEKNGKIMAAFVDYSPVDGDSNWHNEEWDQMKRLPVWSEIFSKDFVAIRPSEEEYSKLFTFAYEKLVEYLDILDNTPIEPMKGAQTIKAQNKYCEHQAQNKKTFAALKRKLGEAQANYFMQNILFPKVEI